MKEIRKDEYFTYWDINKPNVLNITKRRHPWDFDDNIKHRKASKKEIDMYNHGKTVYYIGREGKKAPEESWERLFTFMERNEFSVSDFLACVCASLARYGDNDNDFETQLGVGGRIYDVKITKGKMI